MDNKKIGELIARLRKEKGLTQRELGEKVQVGSRAVSKWECGVTVPDISIINELSEILGISSTELLSGKTLTEHNTKITKPKKKKILKSQLLLIFIPVLLIMAVSITLLIHYNNKTYMYNMMAIDHQKLKVDGYVTYKHGTIELHINEINFNEFKMHTLKYNDYEYYIKLGDEIIVGYGQTKEDNNSYKNYTISDIKEILKINYSGQINLTKKEMLNERIIILLTLIDENNNKNYYQYDISLYKKK